jgi:hypothetical protein
MLHETGATSVLPNIWNSSGPTEAERSSDLAKKLFPLVRIRRPRPVVAADLLGGPLADTERRLRERAVIHCPSAPSPGGLLPKQTPEEEPLRPVEMQSWDV